MDNKDLNAELLRLQAELERLSKKYEQTSASLEASKTMVTRLSSSYTQLEQEHTRVITSRAWRIVNIFYALRDKVLPVTSRRWKVVKAILKPILKPFLFLYRKLRKNKASFNVLDTYSAFQKIKNSGRIDIVAIKHTKFVAELLRGILVSAGIECQIHLSEPAIYEDIPYIMICAQNFKRFPKVYIAFQMEQTVNPRWLTDEYIEILHNAYAVFDYSMVNIEYFSADPKLQNKLFYMPIDVCEELLADNTENENKEYDVIFYGDPYIKRRQEYLDKIGEKFNLKILSNTFGDELYKELNKAKIIINAHYYENALLETTRLYEALSRTDCLIISESSCDEISDKQLKNIVDFTPIGDIDAMLSRIEYWLSHDEERQQKVKKNLQTIKSGKNAAKFFLYRFLLANDCISFDEFYKAVGEFVTFKNDRICLSLPECIARRDAFTKDNKYGFSFFPALKHHFGWIGCGMSYKFILKKAAEQNFKRILVCEDDVYFPDDFEERFNKILSFLDKNDDWNVFSGIMADVGRVKILKHEAFENQDIVYLDKMISMVFNLYDSSVFDLIAGWDENDRDVTKNAIDRYLEDKQLRIVTTCPFLVGHKEDLNSTIWGQQNTMYTSLIEDSSKKLENMLNEYRAK